MLLQGTSVFDQKNDTLLYAGSVNVDITDWFFLKDNIVLKNIELSDAVVHLNRKDSIWNYQFLVDYFSSPSKKTDTSKNVIRLDLKTVLLNNVKILQVDEWKGENMFVALDRLKLITDTFDMNRKVIRIRSLILDHPQFAQLDYEGKRPSRIRIKKIPPQHWNTEGWSLAVKSLEITNGNLAVERLTDRPVYTDRFDDKHIIFSQIEGVFKDLQLVNDTLSADINLSTVNRSGFQVKKLTANARFTPVKMEFNDLDITTNKSRLTNYFSLSYSDFNEDMSEFNNAVFLTGHFKNSEIHSDDVAYFAPELSDWKRKFFVNGNVSGTIENLSGENLTLRSGNTFFRGDATMRGLPDIDNTFIKIRSNELRTSYSELTSFIPQLKSINNPNLRSLGNIAFTGTYSGFIRDFKTQGTISTTLGKVSTDLNMRLSENKEAAYNGHITTSGFHLGTFINNKELGKIAFDGNISGTGFSQRKMDITVNGIIKSIEYHNYNYTNITATGRLKNSNFTGYGTIHDPNVNINNIAGSVNFDHPEPRFILNADITKLDLKKLNFTNKDFLLSGKFDLNFSGKTIDDFSGAARITNATLFTENQQLSFDSLNLRSYISNGEKHLTLETNELEADVAGKFTVAALPNAFKLFLNNYYPSYISKPDRKVPTQEFTFYIRTKNIDQYISLIDKKLKGFNNSVISGDLDLAINHLHLNADVPGFSYGNARFNDVKLRSFGNYDSLSLSTEIAETIIGDSLTLPNTSIYVHAHDDISDISVKTSANQALNEADLSIQLQTLPDGFKIFFNPSSFVINDKKWMLEKGGALTLSKSIFSASEVKFVQDQQEIVISTIPGITGTNDVQIALKKFNVGDVSYFLLKSPRIEGLMSGNIILGDPFKNFSATFNTQTEQFRFENDSVGILKTTGSYTDGKLSGHVISDNQLYNFSSDLSYNFRDSADNDLNIITTLNHSEIHILEKYLTGILNNFYGNATGTLTISGKASSPKITGQLAINKGSLVVSYTQAHYYIDSNTIISFNRDEIDLGTIRIKDSLNNKATVTGKINHSFFQNFYFRNVALNTTRSGGLPGKFVLLNTTKKENKQFYGYMIGDAVMTLNGPEEDMRMNISGEPTDSSHIYLPTGETSEAGKIDYIDFVKFGREMRTNYTIKKQSNLNVNIDIAANPYAKIDVILDDITGDIIKAQGSGKLNINVGTSDPLLIRGRYEILKGEYTFNFQKFLKTPFTLQQGYIEWQGDPYMANLNIDAIYRATKVDMSAILTSSGYAKTKGDIDVIFKLRGTLADPKPLFEFQIPFGNPLKGDPIATEFLRTKYQADVNGLNKQVTSLLLFNAFLPDQQNLLTTNNLGNLGTRTLGQILSNTLSSSLNTWVQKIFKTDAVNLYTNLNTSEFNFDKTAPARQIQNLADVGLKTSFLKNRLIVNFGANVDYSLIQASTNNSSNFLFTPDVSFEYLITPDGKFRVVGFNRSDATLGDITGFTRRNRTGVLLSYRKEFDTFSEFFKGKKAAQ
ncbi:translocation/assembly module TamB domain-containing protein [soil metagenome]